MKRLVLFLMVSIIFVCWTLAQDSGPHAHHEVKFDSLKLSTDSAVHCVGDFCAKGHIHGHLRNYFMATVHPNALTDYWSNATGGSIQYRSAIWKGFQFGVKGIFTYQTLSADLQRVDSIAGKSARWESELYDVNRPGEKHDLDRLEELFVRFHYRPKSFVEYGKIDINEGPLLLRRDGRMKPFVFQGLWGQHQFKDESILKYGWIHRVSPRGMTDWFSFEEAIGLNNNGRQPDGGQATYHRKAPTRGLIAIGINQFTFKKVKLSLWNYHLDKLTHTTWLEAKFQWKSFLFEGQYVSQVAAPHQESLPYSERYYQPDETAQVLAFRSGMKLGGLKLSAAYLHAFDTGRFLFPRELGRERFFVSQPRSWLDGLGATQVVVLRARFNPLKSWASNLSTDLSLSYSDLPERENTRFNKYQRSSFYQVTVRGSYHFPKAFKGVELVFLYVGKFDSGEDSPPLAASFYRTNLHHFNFITNINF